MKKFIVTIIVIIILGAFFGYYNYKDTTFNYKNDVPIGFFDDTKRIIVSNDQYEVLKNFMSGTYTDFLAGLTVQTDLVEGLDNAVMSGDKEYISNNKQAIVDLEKSYQENQIFEKLNEILLTGSRGHINPDSDISIMLGDPLKSSRELIKHLAWMMILRCNLEIDENLCNQYQTTTKELIKKSDRKSSLVSSLINLVNMKYIIQQEKISSTHINLCSDRINREEQYKEGMVNEFNVAFKILLKGVIEPLKENMDLSQLKADFIPKFVFWATNKESLINEIDIQASKKGQEMFYNVISGKDNSIIFATNKKTPFTKIFLAGIGINSNYFIGDLISNILIDSLIPSDNIKSKYKELGELCNN